MKLNDYYKQLINQGINKVYPRVKDNYHIAIHNNSRVIPNGMAYTCIYMKFNKYKRGKIIFNIAKMKEYANKYSITMDNVIKENVYHEIQHSLQFDYLLSKYSIETITKFWNIQEFKQLLEEQANSSGKKYSLEYNMCLFDYFWGWYNSVCRERECHIDGTSS